MAPDPTADRPFQNPAVTGERFCLNGPSTPLDPRVHAVRGDLADIALAGQLFAPHYARARAMRVTAPAAMLRAEPRHAAAASSQLLLGEEFAAVDIAGGWAWGYGRHDHYVGYIEADVLAEPAIDAPGIDHVVTAPEALVFAEPDIKAPVVACWPIGARFAAEIEASFLRTQAGYVHHRHAAPIGEYASDPVEVAERLLASPYRWGGRGGQGVDCSGLVQLATGLCGIAAPRDSDQQCAGLGILLPDDAPPERGDLVFFPGHVGFMVDGDRLIHANAFWMAVTIEPLADVVARLAPDHPQPILARRRLPR